MIRNLLYYVFISFIQLQAQSLNVEYMTYTRDDGVYIESVVLTLYSPDGNHDVINFCIDAKGPRFYTLWENDREYAVIWSEKNNYNARLTLNTEMEKYCRRYPHKEQEILSAFRRLWAYYSNYIDEGIYKSEKNVEKETLLKIEPSMLDSKTYSFTDKKYKGNITFFLSAGRYLMELSVKGGIVDIKGKLQHNEAKIILTPETSGKDITWGLLSKKEGDGKVILEFKDYNDQSNKIYLTPIKKRF